MSNERPRAARSITHTKEKTFNGSDKDPLLTSMRAAASTVDEAEDGQFVLLAAEGDREALRSDGSGHWESRGRASAALRSRGQENSSELAKRKVLDFGSGCLL